MKQVDTNQSTPAAEPSAAAPTAAGIRRRDVVVAAAGIGVGAAAATAGASLIGRPAAAQPVAFGTERNQQHAHHQAGVGSHIPAFANYIAMDLTADLDNARIIALLRILSEDARRLMAGTAPVGDQEPELAETPAGLQITFGFSPGFIDRINPKRRPEWLTQIPKFSVDRLTPEWSEGELLMLVASDDPLTLAHASRTLLKDARSFGTVRWQQHGFRQSRGSLAAGQTDRNLFGQVDGTVNATPGTDDFDQVVTIRSESGETEWLNGGTTLVIRRIHMDLETWDEVDRPGREASVGRRLDTGAPLTGSKEHDEPDFKAVTAQGFTVINPASHLRRMRSDNPHERIVRRPYNYEMPVAGGSGAGAVVSDSGQIFTSLQANVTTQFVPLQRRMDEGDLLNTWITPIGSAVFAIPPKPDANGFVGEGLFA